MDMHVIEPKRYKQRAKRRRWWPYMLTIIILVLITGAVNYLRPLPAVTISLYLSVPATKTPDLAWPLIGQAAVAADNYGILSTNGAQTPIATASIAKVITALCVLQKQPLAPGQPGPTYTVDPTDISIFHQYASEQGSLIPVQQGEQLTEYQALEALMLPSANNIADSLARWVFGSQDAYTAYATTFLQQHGIDNTHIGPDASGFDISTTSTASDLTQLGVLALKSPVLMQIVGQKSAILPIVNEVTNYDTVLGQDGIDGIKTGNNQADPGTFLFGAAKELGGQTINLTGTVMGAPNLNVALQEGVKLAASLSAGFEQVHLVRANQTVGTVHTAWSASTSVITTNSLQLVRWEATPITEKHQINTTLLSGTIGSLTAVAGPTMSSTPLHLGHTLAGPAFWWRLTRH